MAAERAKVLEMLADGRITVEEADRLLEALAEQSPRRQERQERIRFVDNEDIEIPSVSIPSIRIPKVKVKGPKIVHRHRVRGDDEDVIVNNPSFDRLVKLGMYGISPSYITELREAGLTDITFRDVTKLGMAGVKPDYIKSVREVFGDRITPRQIAKLSMYGVTMDYLKEVQEVLKEVGIENLSIRNIIKMAMFNISPQYIKEMKEAGMLNLEDEEESAVMGPEFDGDFEEATQTIDIDAIQDAVDAATEVEVHKHDQ